MKKILILTAMLSFLAGCSSQKKEEITVEKEVKPPPTAVEGIKATKSSLDRIILTAGLASGINEAYVVSETQGKIISTNFNLGQYVKKGQTLVQVENTIQKRAYEQSSKAKESAEIDLKITQKLFDEGNASKMELTFAQNQFEGAFAAYEQSKKQLRDTYVSAPISGYIAQKESVIQKGNILSGGSMITRIVNIKMIKVQFDLGEQEIGIVKKGLPVEFRVPAANNKQFTGKIRAVAAGSNPANGSYPVEAIFKNSKDLAVKSGMTVRATIITEAKDTGFVVPSKAVVSKNEKNVLFISVNNRAQLRFVTTGRMTDTETVIKKGLQEGMDVITSAVDNLTAGDSILITLLDEAGEQK